MGVPATERDAEGSSKYLPLNDVRIIECGDGVAAAFAAKLMALLGAQVIKVEPPEGDRTRFRGPFFDDRIDPDLSGLFLYLNTDKSCIALDLHVASDRAKLDELLATSDVLIHNVPPYQRA
jgi:crotonobetainyl-CoA:carnitine CoA-transferase CaiB-like acyl-CoA transferase